MAQETGKWRLTVKHCGPKNARIPVKLTYGGESITVTATSENVTYDTEWETEIGTPINEADIEVSGGTVVSGDTTLKITTPTFKAIKTYEGDYFEVIPVEDFVSNSSYTMVSGGSTELSFEVYSNVWWHPEADDLSGGTVDFVHFSTDGGNKNNVLTVTIDANTGSTRAFGILIRANNVELGGQDGMDEDAPGYYYRIMQPAENPENEVAFDAEYVDVTKFELKGETVRFKEINTFLRAIATSGMTIQMHVTSNVSWYVRFTDDKNRDIDYATADITGSTDSSTNTIVNITVAPNSTSENRPVYVTFYPSNYVAQGDFVPFEFKAVQYAYHAESFITFANQSSLRAYSYGGCYYMHLQCNDEWYLDSHPDWAYIGEQYTDPGSPFIKYRALQEYGTGSARIGIVLTARGSSGRSGTMVFKTKGGAQTTLAVS